jgi:hypothetical protein
MAGNQNTTSREKRNWQIHLLYIRQDYKECLRVIDQQLQECHGESEYALYAKALILRQQGQILQSLKHFQMVFMRAPFLCAVCVCSVPAHCAAVPVAGDQAGPA